jgi:hypothetical protein
LNHVSATCGKVFGRTMCDVDLSIVAYSTAPYAKVASQIVLYLSSPVC